MDQHITATIAAIETRITSLQDMSRDLRRLFGDAEPPTAAAPAPIARASKPRKAKPRKAKTEAVAGNGLSMADAVREVFRQSDGTMTAKYVRSEIAKAHPDLPRRALSTTLIGFVKKGELNRTGNSTKAIYRKGKIKGGISDKETAYRQFRQSITPEPAA
jgi:hypothetical protein